MATSESDDFESADEEMSQDQLARRKAQTWTHSTAVDSESDDDTEFVPRTTVRNTSAYSEQCDRPFPAAARAGGRIPAPQSQEAKESGAVKRSDSTLERDQKDPAPEKSTESTSESTGISQDVKQAVEVAQMMEEGKEKVERLDRADKSPTECPKKEAERVTTRLDGRQKENVRGQRRSEGSRQTGAKKLGTRISKSSTETSVMNNKIDEVGSIEVSVPEEQSDNAVDDKESQSRLSELPNDRNEGELCHSGTMEELSESDMPEELKSDKKFKDIFKPQGWESLGNDVELPEELTEDKLQPVLERLSLAGQDAESNSGSWGGWGVSSLISTATVGVSALTSHVTHGLSLLEESIAASDSPESPLITEQEGTIEEDKSPSSVEESQLHVPFGFSNLIAGVSSITRLVESTGSKVMIGGLDTLEAIGKKTMEVLQEGDPGLKKKRAFFMQDDDIPVLSQILREAEEKADAEKKTLEEKQLARKVHFESLFDDYQGLLHLEALEMLSKQREDSIQQHLATLHSDELIHIQEILGEVKELCDLGDKCEEEEDQRDLKIRLEEASYNLAVDISYEKLHSIWEESRSYLDPSVTHTEQEIFQTAMSTIARFTAYSVESFHKTAQLLVHKKLQTSESQARALNRLTSILSNEIGVLANSFCNSLNELAKTADNPDNIKTNITTIFFEASNASYYVEDAFRLMIPIIQYGAIYHQLYASPKPVPLAKTNEAGLIIE